MTTLINPSEEIKAIFSGRPTKPNHVGEPVASAKSENPAINPLPDDPEKRYCYYLEQKDWNQALIILENLKNSTYTEDEFFFKKIKLLTNLKKFKDASLLVQQKIKTHPPNSKLYFVLSRILFEEGDYQLSLEYIQKSIKMESQKVIYLYWLGIVEKKHGLLEQAKQRFTKALQYEKDSAKIQYQLGIVLFEMQDYKTAIPVFEKLQDHNQFKANVIWYLAHSYQQIHDEIKTDRYFLKLKELQNTTNFQKK